MAFTTLFHKRILTHLNDKFVNLAGITAQIRERRKKQNASNFKGSVLFQLWRLFAVLPLCILSLFPGSFVQSGKGQIIYLIFHFFSTIYQSCGVASFFLATYTIFNRDELRHFHIFYHTFTWTMSQKFKIGLFHNI